MANNVDSCLRGRSVSDLQPPQTPLVVLAADEDLNTAYQKLTDAHIRSAPVYSEEKKAYVGFVGLRDIVSILLFLCGKGEELGLRWPEDNRALSFADISGKHPFMPIPTDASLLELAQKVAVGLEHLPIVDSNGNLVRIVSRKDLIKWLNNNIDQDSDLKNFFNQPVSKLPSSSLSELVSVNGEESILHGLALLHKHGIWGLPVLENGKLIGNLSVSDFSQVLEFCERPAKEFVQVMQSGPIVCSTTDTLRDVIRLFAAHEIQRVYVADEELRPLGIVSSRDIFKALLPA